MSCIKDINTRRRVIGSTLRNKRLFNIAKPFSRISRNFVPQQTAPWGHRYTLGESKKVSPIKRTIQAKTIGRPDCQLLTKQIGRRRMAQKTQHVILERRRLPHFIRAFLFHWSSDSFGRIISGCQTVSGRRLVGVRWRLIWRHLNNYQSTKGKSKDNWENADGIICGIRGKKGILIIS